MGNPAFIAALSARQIIEQGLFPGNEDQLKALAKKHHVGRMINTRTIGFTPDDLKDLWNALPCPSNSSDAQDHPSGICAAPSVESELQKARALIKKQQQTKSGSKEKPNSSTSPSTVTPFRGRSRRQR